MFSKVLVTSSMLFLFLLHISSCKSETREIEQTKVQKEELTVFEEIAQNEILSDNTQSKTPEFIPLVFVASSVSTGKPGTLVNFTWKQNGKEVNFSDFAKNKIVLLNFWGTWCPPCRKELPDLIEIHNESEGQDYVVVGVTLERDPANAETIVKDFAKKQGIKYLNIVDKDHSIARAYGGISAVPTTFIIDKKGKIVETLVGARPKRDFIDAISRARK
ncbi:MAG: TlpA family protein disulfide reductase [Ignavibacteria bacterium]|nr:TlpA family protein disulfide reductase [Ignavibacteria bacterium]